MQKIRSRQIMNRFTKVLVDKTVNPLSDKVILPQAYLTSLVENHGVEFDTSKPVILELTCYDRENNLFSKCVCGVREFALEDAETIGLPHLLFSNLKLSLLQENPFAIEIKIISQAVPNGTDLSLEPLGEIQWDNFIKTPERYFENEDEVDGYNVDFINDDSYVKRFLEARFNNTLTVLSKANNILFVSQGENGGKSSTVFKFKIHEMKPSSVICIVNVDLNLEIVHKVRFPVDQNKNQIGDAEPYFPETSLTPNNKDQNVVADIKIGEVVHVENPSYIYRLQADVSCNLEIISNDLQESMQIVVGSDEFLDSDCFVVSTIGANSSNVSNNVSSGAQLHLHCNDKPYYLKAIFLNQEAFGKKMDFRFAVTQQNTETTDKTMCIETGCERCPHCGKEISKSAFMMHELRCQKTSFACKRCNKKYEAMNKDHLENGHWHCSDLHQSTSDLENHIADCNGDSATSYENHLKWLHMSDSNNYMCDWCTDSTFNRLYDLALHKENECPEHPKICNFCHLLLPRGKINFQTTYYGLQGEHEFKCGSKTTECYKCNSKVRLFEMNQHLALHKLKQREKFLNASLASCSNKNCCNVIENGVTNNKHGLCEVCFGKFYSTDIDKDDKKFKMKLERRYIIQLTKGCGYTHCKNTMCKSSGLVKGFDNMRDTLQFVHDQINKVSGANEFYLCVDESVTKRKMNGDMYMDSLNAHGFPAEWVYKAVNTIKTSNMQELDAWLNDNVITETGF